MLMREIDSVCSDNCVHVPILRVKELLPPERQMISYLIMVSMHAYVAVNTATSNSLVNSCFPPPEDCNQGFTQQ